MRRGVGIGAINKKALQQVYKISKLAKLKNKTLPFY
jgi:hypothetical protein